MIDLDDLAAKLRGGDPHTVLMFLFGMSGVLTFPLLFFVSAPYGKLYREGFGAPIDGRLGWFVQEIISPVMLLWTFLGGLPGRLLRSPPPPAYPHPVYLFIFLWCLHYANRAVVYPLRRHMSLTNVAVVGAAVAFNVVNGALVGAEIAGEFASWGAFANPRVAGGLALMAFGAWLNISSDAILLSLRKGKGDRGYYIPRGGLFRLVACPHFLGEMLEWTGFAAATATASGAVFALWTVCNLAPRAKAQLNWYRQKFRESYPKERKALVPYVW